MGDEIDEFKPKRPVVFGLFVTDTVQVEAQPSNPRSRQPPAIEIDTASHFATDKQESDRDELIKWARGVAEKLRFAIIVRRSSSGGDNQRKAQLVVECERGGQCVPAKKKLKSDSTGTRKCKCPFRLGGYYSKETKL
ncbi:otubain [Trifolium pratense]|uniref:Otubain n=1 Tax=Trifolium pratense TaxID=57577 RepID=A0A2K3N944_TRIPR|nr:otubain [Trifolium pratense]